MTNSQLGNVPAHFFRKATLKNRSVWDRGVGAYRRRNVRAREKSANLEYEIFYAGSVRRLGNISNACKPQPKEIVTVDVLQGLAVVAENQHPIRPEFGQDPRKLTFKGRHVVVEKVMGAQTYIPIVSKWVKILASS